MDKDRMKGAANDAAGRVKRQVGEWTNNPRTQAEGAAQQAKGKVQKAWGNVKDAAKDATRNIGTNVNREHGGGYRLPSARQSETEREREHAHSGSGPDNWKHA